MRKIGILFGAENTLPGALVEKINSQERDGLQAEFVNQSAVMLDEPSPYAVILDRISHEIPFYRAALKHAALHGAVVVNNPFWWSADDKFLNYSLAAKLGVAVPRTVLLPQKHTRHSDPQLLRNLEYPLDWEGIFAHVGFPAYLKPIDGGGWHDVQRVHSADEFFHAYDRSGQRCMVVQQAIEHQSYYRCLVVGDKVRVTTYDPHAPHEGRFVRDAAAPESALANRLEGDARRLCQALGYHCNTVEFAVKDGVPYAIDFMNPAPDFDLHSIGQEHFDWVVETLAEFLMQQVNAPHEPVPSWSRLLQPAGASPPAKKSPSKKAAAKPAPKKAAVKDSAGSPKSLANKRKAIDTLSATE